MWTVWTASRFVSKFDREIMLVSEWWFSLVVDKTIKMFKDFFEWELALAINCHLPKVILKSCGVCSKDSKSAYEHIDKTKL